MKFRQGNADGLLEDEGHERFICIWCYPLQGIELLVVCIYTHLGLFGSRVCVEKKKPVRPSEFTRTRGRERVGRGRERDIEREAVECGY